MTSNKRFQLHTQDRIRNTKQWNAEGILGVRDNNGRLRKWSSA